MSIHPALEESPKMDSYSTVLHKKQRILRMFNKRGKVRLVVTEMQQQICTLGNKSFKFTVCALK